MRLTTDHPQSSYGMPIFVDSNNAPVDYVAGVNWIKFNFGLTAQTLAGKIGVSKRTVDDWCTGQIPSKTALLLIKNVFAL